MTGPGEARAARVEEFRENYGSISRGTDFTSAREAIPYFHDCVAEIKRVGRGAVRLRNAAGRVVSSYKYGDP